jgi:hypothetical protein
MQERLLVLLSKVGLRVEMQLGRMASLRSETRNEALRLDGCSDGCFNGTFLSTMRNTG